jgi:hypothetical protein
MGSICLKYGAFTAVYGQISAVYVPFFTGIQVGGLRPYLRGVVYGGCRYTVYGHRYQAENHRILAEYGRFCAVLFDLGTTINAIIYKNQMNVNI